MSGSCALQRCSLVSGGRHVSGPPPAASAAARSHKLGRLRSKLQVGSISSVPTGIEGRRGGGGPAAVTAAARLLAPKRMPAPVS